MSSIPDPKKGLSEVIPPPPSTVPLTGEFSSVKNSRAGWWRRVALLVLGLGLIWVGSMVRYNPNGLLVGWESRLIHGTAPPTGLVRLMRVNELRELGLIPFILGSTFLAMIAWDWLRPRR